MGNMNFSNFMKAIHMYSAHLGSIICSILIGGVNSVHRALFKSLTCANIGPSNAHHIIKEQVGGFQNVECSKQNLKIIQRDLKAFIKDYDAQMFIENFKRKQNVHPSFYFAYELDVDGTLNHVFWACLLYTSDAADE